MYNTSIIRFTAWGPNAGSIFDSLGPAEGDDTLCICLLQFQVQPTVDTSYPKVSELKGTLTTTMVKLDASQQNSLFLQDTAVLNLHTHLTTFEVLAGATSRFSTNVCGIVRNVRDEQDTSTGKLQKTIELLDVAGNALELRACGSIATHEDLTVGARLGLFFVQALASRKPGYRGTFWVYDISHPDTCLPFEVAFNHFETSNRTGFSHVFWSSVVHAFVVLNV